MDFNDNYLIEKMNDINYKINFITKASNHTRDKKLYLIEVIYIKTKETEISYHVTKKEYNEIFAQYKKIHKND